MREPAVREQLPLASLARTGRRITAAAVFPVSSLWFQGHFPAAAVLPGAALMALVVEPVLITAETEGRTLYVRGFSKMRIKTLSFPGDELLVAIDAMPPLAEAELAFEVTCRGEPICQGRVLVAEG